MREKKMPGWQDWAQFRFAVIGALLTRPPESGELQLALETLARQTYQHPINPEKRIRLSFTTIQRWYYQARNASDPIAVLARKRRMDAGVRPSSPRRCGRPSRPSTRPTPAGACSCTMTTCARFAASSPN